MLRCTYAQLSRIICFTSLYSYHVFYYFVVIAPPPASSLTHHLPTFSTLLPLPSLSAPLSENVSILTPSLPTLPAPLTPSRANTLALFLSLGGLLAWSLTSMRRECFQSLHQSNIVWEKFPRIYELQSLIFATSFNPWGLRLLIEWYRSVHGSVI